MASNKGLLEAISGLVKSIATAPGKVIGGGAEMLGAGAGKLQTTLSDPNFQNALQQFGEGLQQTGIGVSGIEGTMTQNQMLEAQQTLQKLKQGRLDAQSQKEMAVELEKMMQQEQTQQEFTQDSTGKVTRTVKSLKRPDQEPYFSMLPPETQAIAMDNYYKSIGQNKSEASLPGVTVGQTAGAAKKPKNIVAGIDINSLAPGTIYRTYRESSALKGVPGKVPQDTFEVITPEQRLKIMDRAEKRALARFGAKDEGGISDEQRPQYEALVEEMFPQELKKAGLSMVPEEKVFDQQPMVSLSQKERYNQLRLQGVSPEEAKRIVGV